jgi:hypothetical protein
LANADRAFEEPVLLFWGEIVKVFVKSIEIKIIIARGRDPTFAFLAVQAADALIPRPGLAA